MSEKLQLGMNNRLKKIQFQQEEILKRLDSLEKKADDKTTKRSASKYTQKKSLKDKQQDIVNSEYERIRQSGKEFHKRMECEKEKERQYREANPNWQAEREAVVAKGKAFLRRKMSM